MSDYSRPGCIDLRAWCEMPYDHAFTNDYQRRLADDFLRMLDERDRYRDLLHRATVRDAGTVRAEAE